VSGVEKTLMLMSPIKSIALLSAEMLQQKTTHHRSKEQRRQKHERTKIADAQPVANHSQYITMKTIVPLVSEVKKITRNF